MKKSIIFATREMKRNKINSRMGVEDNILSLIGGTPLIRLKKVVKGFDGNFFPNLKLLTQATQTKTELHFTLSKKPKIKAFLNLVILSLRLLPATLVLV